MKDIATVGVLGAGTMGAGIAQIVVESGLEALIHDPLPGATARAMEKIEGFLERKVEKGQLVRDDADAARRRLRAADTIEGLAAADVIIEAAPEDLALKRDIFEQLDRLAPDVILATNTSSLSVARIAGATESPHRVLGMHFFNPVPLMRLVEIVAGPMTDAAVTDAVAEFARRLGKTPVVAADTPGFIVNRVQRALYLEGFRIFEEGLATVDTVDSAIRGLGFRMGPFELADVVGTDVNLAAGAAIFDGFFGDPRYRPALVQRQVVDAGRLGRKQGAGYYDYTADGARGTAWAALDRRAATPPVLPPLDAAQIEARVLAAVVNEAASAVADGTATPASIDTAMRLATNWPDGPLAWGERIGLAAVVGTLDALHAVVPDGRYRVSPLLRLLAASGGSFHSHGA